VFNGFGMHGATAMKQQFGQVIMATLSLAIRTHLLVIFIVEVVRLMMRTCLISRHLSFCREDQYRLRAWEDQRRAAEECPLVRLHRPAAVAPRPRGISGCARGEGRPPIRTASPNV
jgi:hypothetical protein